MGCLSTNCRPFCLAFAYPPSLSIFSSYVPCYIDVLKCQSTHTYTRTHAPTCTHAHTHTKTQSNAGAAIQLNTHDCMNQPSFKTPSPLHQLKHVLRIDQLTSKQNTSSKWGQMVFFRTEVRLTSLCLSLPHDKVTMA